MGGRTQDSVQRISHVDRVELGSRQGAAHGPVCCWDKCGSIEETASCNQNHCPRGSSHPQEWRAHAEKVLGSSHMGPKYRHPHKQVREKNKHWSVPLGTNLQAVHR